MTVNINAADISGIRLAEQGSNPATPASGFGQLFAKADGLYFIGDDGVVEGPLSRDMGARVYNDANISVTGSVSQAMTFNQERWDTDSFHSTISQTSRLTIPVAGKYLIGGSVSFASSTVGIRILFIRLNGSTILTSQSLNPTLGSATTDMSISTEYVLAVNDYVELWVYQTSGGGLIVNSTGNHSPEFWIRRTG